ncbi:hypothetical protein SK854_20620 [Lentzea sp. BCCO 10_0061]|uniref:Uncharacterized protein n=1 Tax=Lentzea sokolovensis TaxID=3095429 RepID=A0ABU4UYJ0_9PSEU|nr:hypothetical protein [Lentzea sp. BCCO 10_0061]MDX8144534.1 hypothetical protein [Lentzea sp. BCCO 10_0061]
MTDPTPEPSPDAEGQNASQPPPDVDQEAIFKALSGIDLNTIEADIESAFGSRMAELDKMLEGLDDLVNKIESDLHNLDQPKPESPQ